MNEFLVNIRTKSCIRKTDENFTVIYNGVMYYVEAVDVKNNTLHIVDSATTHMSGITKIVSAESVYQDTLRDDLNMMIIKCLRVNGYGRVADVLEELDTV